ncbi:MULTISPECIES: 4'-phosphopantetheinyl transferase superfamily protein [unclassified Streptomyces]|uniref:4'-phosphopantetheinyl transferase family protein n=1 Tax=unclassified Streptomyces TaxID=2593676 RepID=UPI0029AD443E|nr:4'-phosphopantetheinyl transferase superfamily protein [Streptomyces sp. DK15]MDX2396331.1 4'-phosphopantetheinyl transferase superfamily protein [Streptomyces sp. DK15]
MTTRSADDIRTVDTTFSSLDSADALVWWWRIPHGRFSSADLALLDTSEASRARAFKSTKRAAEFISSRATIRRILSGILRIPALDISIGRAPCGGCGDAEHGPPAVVRPDISLCISLSHTAGLGMLAVSPHPVGIDAEPLRDVPVTDIADVALTPRERRAVLAEPAGPARSLAFLRCWTRKEAVLKAAGVGITDELAKLETHADAPGPAEVTTLALGAPSTWWVTDAEVPTGWTATVALPADVGHQVVVRPF